jgi:hypothetical protein
VAAGEVAGDVQDGAAHVEDTVDAEDDGGDHDGLDAAEEIERVDAREEVNREGVNAETCGGRSRGARRLRTSRGR